MQGGGSPPRERGARGQTQHPERRRRFTPAWAGSTKQWVPYGPVVPGSPPRGRGAPSGCSPLADRGRFTPAWAGSTRPAASPRARPPVHPRVGGEHDLHRRLRGRRPGSPPRGRGAPTQARDSKNARRFTPAWAGSTATGCRTTRRVPVHPRVGGEHVDLEIVGEMGVGSPPRGRGAPRAARPTPASRRFTPAWAGSTSPSFNKSRSHPVHPRVGGEHFHGRCHGRRPVGSPPRGRGAQSRVRRPNSTRRFTPAWAGSTTAPRPSPRSLTVHPRVGGEHEGRLRASSWCFGSPPRGRGAPTKSVFTCMPGRFTPAWAGSTRSSRRRSTPGSVHPRVGGEHGNGVSTGDDIHGSPPRGRGALQATHRGFERVRFTPAWAGSTPPMRCRIPRHRFTPAWAGSTAARPRTA